MGVLFPGFSGDLSLLHKSLHPHINKGGVYESRVNIRLRDEMGATDFAFGRGAQSWEQNSLSLVPDASPQRRIPLVHCGRENWS